MQTIGHYWQGATVAGKGKRSGEVFNPATGQCIAHLAFATKEEVKQAVQHATVAFPQWARTPAVRRARILFKFRELLLEHQDELAALVTKEHGKILADAQGSVSRAIELVEHHCGITTQLQGRYSAQVSTQMDCYTIRQPLGVCVGVAPFNFPVMVPMWLAIPAIACGNTFVLKPSEKTPSAPMKLAELLSAAGLPEGVFNIVNGDKETVDHLLTQPEVQAASAVASTPVAKAIYQTAVTHGKRSQTFGGAKNHGVVMPDADLDQVAQALMGAGYGSAGERCMAISVVVAVGDQVAEGLLERLVGALPQLKIGPGDQHDVEMGPLISKQHLEHVRACIDAGVKEGAELLVDGRDFSVAGHEAGYFLGGSLFDRVTPEMSIYQQEIFGPVLSIVRVASFTEALQLVNQHPYGNGTAIFTHRGDVAHAFVEQVQVGMVGINVPIPVPVAYHSFGGWKQSHFGDVHLHGDQAVQFYTKLKSITSKWPSNQKLQSEYTMPYAT